MDQTVKTLFSWKLGTTRGYHVDGLSQEGSYQDRFHHEIMVLSREQGLLYENVPRDTTKNISNEQEGI